MKAAIALALIFIVAVQAEVTTLKMYSPSVFNFIVIGAGIDPSKGSAE